MSENPLSGISVSSVKDIAEGVVERLSSSTLDLANPLQRKRLQDYIEHQLNAAISFELEHALQAASGKAITHIFRLMRDSDYQKKRKQNRVYRAKLRLEKKRKIEEAARQSRMDCSRKQIKIASPEKDLIQ
jgi:hypothetical protein